jgi:hypothetical protein
MTLAAECRTKGSRTKGSRTKGHGKLGIGYTITKDVKLAALSGGSCRS